MIESTAWTIQFALPAFELHPAVNAILPVVFTRRKRRARTGFGLIRQLSRKSFRAGGVVFDLWIQTENEELLNKLLKPVVNSAPMQIGDEIIDICRALRAVLMIVGMFEDIK